MGGRDCCDAPDPLSLDPRVGRWRPPGCCVPGKRMESSKGGRAGYGPGRPPSPVFGKKVKSKVFLRALRCFKLMVLFPFQLSGASEKWEQEGVCIVFWLPTSTFRGALAAQKLGHHGDPREGGRRISEPFSVAFGSLSRISGSEGQKTVACSLRNFSRNSLSRANPGGK